MTGPRITIERMPVTLRAAGQENWVLVRPIEYLGPQMFNAFRNACQGAGVTWCRAEKQNRAKRDDVPRIVTALQAHGFTPVLDDDLRAAVTDEAQKVIDAEAAAMARVARWDDELSARGLALYPYQRTGVRWLAGRNAALLGDEMGTGKTVTTAIALPEGDPILVVCPAALRHNWARELRKWRPDLTVFLPKGKAAFRWPTANEVVIVSYDQTPTSLDGMPAHLRIVADEAHNVKNRRTKRAKALAQMIALAVQNGGSAWALTGTPLVNRPQELWSLLETFQIDREAFGSFFNFYKAFGGRKASRWGGTTWGDPDASVVPALRRVMLRRERKDVLPDLPAKRWAVREVELSAEAEAQCNKVLDLIKAAGIDLETATAEALKQAEYVAFEEMARTRAVLADAKIPAAVEIVTEYEDAGEPLVVFCSHKAPIQFIGARDGWACITGDTSQERRDEIVQTFQAGELKGVAITTRAGGVGLTLTRAAHALFIDQPWTPADLDQAEDRICRIGQEAKGLLYTRLVAEHYLEERIQEIIDTKRGIIGGSIEAAAGEHDEPSRGEALSELAAVVTAAPSMAEAEAEREAQKAQARDQFIQRAASRGKFPPRNAREQWAANALVTLAGLDPDRAAVANDVGFNSADGEIGHSFAEQLQTWGVLSEKQWKLAINICRKYHRQVGQCPEAS